MSLRTIAIFLVVVGVVIGIVSLLADYWDLAAHPIHLAVGKSSVWW